MRGLGTLLAELEAEAIHIFRESVAQSSRPVMLFSAGKDSTVLAHLALRAFYPAKPPFPLLHIDSTWEFKSLIAFRDAFARNNGFNLIVRANEQGRAAGVNPFDHGEYYTSAMRTEPLKAALDEGRFDIIFGGARRDEDQSRAKERVISFRTASHAWDPRQQRPELWQIFNARCGPGQTARVFPLSNWTEADIWNYALARQIPLAPLYFAEPRPVVERNGTLIVVDDASKMRLEPNERIQQKVVRFRTLGCWPVTGAVESRASDVATVLQETELATTSERRGRIGDGKEGESLEQKKREGYF
ncbi:MAG: sulfate adenylyltransferase subunit CysD [Methyloceanibacter sp.]|nr:sulfate adenylyltransferase subunit CysD [Methyloceanibacter sp.]